MGTVDRGQVPNVVPLPGEGPPPEPVVEPSPPGRLHGLAIAGMGISALVGVAAVLAFITISWPRDMSRYVVAVFLGAGLAFLTCASIAVFSAARDTYRNGHEDDG
ncbi:MAG: hypothetical protein M3238_05735 [Actinomycetota bacterium]|nr:hypothetical protein [Actinomycetota bacterium]